MSDALGASYPVPRPVLTSDVPVVTTEYKPPYQKGDRIRVVGIDGYVAVRAMTADGGVIVEHPDGRLITVAPDSILS